MEEMHSIRKKSSSHMLVTNDADRPSENYEQKGVSEPSIERKTQCAPMQTNSSSRFSQSLSTLNGSSEQEDEKMKQDKIHQQ